MRLNPVGKAGIVTLEDGTVGPVSVDNRAALAFERQMPGAFLSNMSGTTLTFQK